MRWKAAAALANRSQASITRNAGLFLLIMQEVALCAEEFMLKAITPAQVEEIIALLN
jgi:hypothetical protein